MVERLTLAATAIIFSLSAMATQHDPTLREGHQQAVTGDSFKADQAYSGQQRLQLVVTGSKGMAVIDGNEYKIGDKVGDSRLVSVSDGQAVLKDRSGRKEILTLSPIIKKDAVPERLRK